MLRRALTYGLLRAVKAVSRLLWDHEVRWVGGAEAGGGVAADAGGGVAADADGVDAVDPDGGAGAGGAGDPWAPVARMRVLAILNHTSLYEPILSGAAPDALLRRVAEHGVAPIALKTIRRPLVGRFFRLLARRVIPITRERDHTWETVLSRADDPEALVIILPEGRMKRRDGLDAAGEPMTVRGGIADILRTVPAGSMLLAYSAGLHHVHAPVDRFPRLFRTVRLSLEWVDVEAYRRRREAEAGPEGFKGAVIRDLTRRRDRYCAWEERPAAERGPPP